MNDYILMLDKGEYKIEIYDKEELKQMIDNLVHLLQMYNIDDEDILEYITRDTCAEIEKIN